MELTVSANGWEDLGFNGGWAEFNTAEDSGVEDVDTSVDSVSNELNWLLDESVNATGMAWLVHDDTILAGFFNLCDDNGSLLSVSLVELGQGLEGVVADDIRVEDEEGVIILSKDLFGELEGTGSAEWFVLNAECDSNIVLFFILCGTRPVSKRDTSESNGLRRLLPA
jgi:hypothetical protein